MNLFRISIFEFRIYTHMNKTLPIVAIVGPPNVGKSTLLNKIAGRPMAVTSDVPGTTRDRQYADISWNEKQFTLVDTAGLNLHNLDALEHSLHRQIEIALDEADAIILVADGKQPTASIEQAVLKKFRKIKKPLLLAINKLDGSAVWNEKISEFQHLGIKKLFPVSAINGRGLGDLLDAVADVVPKVKKAAANDEGSPRHSIAVSIVGKPNVGKSSIFNFILKEERVVVSPVAGTTRTAIDSDLVIEGQKYTFIDTAGLKKKEYRQAQPDVFSGFQTFKSIRRSDVCLFVIDASQEITKQDQRVASEIFAMEKGCIILANKCDLLKTEKAAGTLGKNTRSIGQNQDDKYQTVRDYISHHFPFLWMCPLLFVSAIDGEGLEEVAANIKTIYEARHKQLDQEVLTDFLQKKMKINPPKLLRDQKKPKVTGLMQMATNPPAFQLMVNHPAAISQQFRKYIENSITKELDFWGTPIVLRLKGKDKS